MSGPCDAGYECKTNAASPTPTDGTTGQPCPMGLYCPQGSYQGRQHCLLQCLGLPHTHFRLTYEKKVIVVDILVLV